MEEKKKIKSVVSSDEDTWKEIEMDEAVKLGQHAKWVAFIEGEDKKYVFKRHFVDQGELNEWFALGSGDGVVEYGYRSAVDERRRYRYIWKKDKHLYLIDRATAKKLVEDGVI